MDAFLTKSQASKWLSLRILKIARNFERPFVARTCLRPASNFVKTLFRRLPTFHFPPHQLRFRVSCFAEANCRSWVARTGPATFPESGARIHGTSVPFHSHHFCYCALSFSSCALSFPWFLLLCHFIVLLCPFILIMSFHFPFVPFHFSSSLSFPLAPFHFSSCTLWLLLVCPFHSPLAPQTSGWPRWDFDVEKPILWRILVSKIRCRLIGFGQDICMLAKTLVCLSQDNRSPPLYKKHLEAPSLWIVFKFRNEFEALF